MATPKKKLSYFGHLSEQTPGVSAKEQMPVRSFTLPSRFGLERMGPFSTTRMQPLIEKKSRLRDPIFLGGWGGEVGTFFRLVLFACLAGPEPGACYDRERRDSPRR